MVTEPRIPIWWSNTIFFASIHIFAVWGAFYWRPLYAVPKATAVLALLVWQLADFGYAVFFSPTIADSDAPFSVASRSVPFAPDAV
jgi:hypothetical protein